MLEYEDAGTVRMYMLVHHRHVRFKQMRAVTFMAACLPEAGHETDKYT